LACGAVQVFTADLTLRNPTSDEHEKFSRDQRIIDVQMARAHLVGDKLKGYRPRNFKPPRYWR
jgi:hypothetical protein